MRRDGECIGIPAANQGGDSVESVIDEVRRIIARELKVPLEHLTPDTALPDLGVESLDLIEIIFALEEKFDISKLRPARNKARCTQQKRVAFLCRAFRRNGYPLH